MKSRWCLLSRKLKEKNNTPRLKKDSGKKNLVNFITQLCKKMSEEYLTSLFFFGKTHAGNILVGAFLTMLLFPTLNS